ncbi:MAG: hypothetical protein Q9193_002892 [Seirophora villosa]
MGDHTPVAAEEYDYEGLPPNFTLVENMAAGAFAGIAEHTLMYPFDLLKTRLQVINPSPGGLYTGVSHALSTISKAEGVGSLWRGISSVVVGAGTADNAISAQRDAGVDAQHRSGACRLFCYV